MMMVDCDCAKLGNSLSFPVSWYCDIATRNGHLVIWEPSIEVQDLQSMKDNENIKAKAAEKELEEPDDIRYHSYIT